ncbi:hypothetical protein BDZ94DRAFT_1233249 [Collybia nuda]|uniref:Uncharacterized protein n=1 Tax=Collybia nuda TaxID=64659 RepID=A0A9P6CI11_9AGAR|nr:hypothetical protein BDZ94DRAFT_1233249 [Collybia nuda]
MAWSASSEAPAPLRSLLYSLGRKTPRLRSSALECDIEGMMHNTVPSVELKRRHEFWTYIIMKFSQILAPLSMAAALATGTLAQFVVNTPSNAVVCQPVLLTWTGGEAPYFLEITPANKPSGPALRDLGIQTGTQFTWIVDIAAGTAVGIFLRDSTGAIVQSAPFTINAGLRIPVVSTEFLNAYLGTSMMLMERECPPNTAVNEPPGIKLDQFYWLLTVALFGHFWFTFIDMDCGKVNENWLL